MIFRICAVMLGLSLMFSAFYGNFDALGTGFSQGISGSTELLLSLSGGMCFWCGVCEIMEKSGISETVAHLFRPFINRLFKKETDREFLSSVSQNLSANFLGLGNLATMSGLKSAKILFDKGKTHLVSRLIVLNTASIQLLPTSLCTVRASLGAVNAYDILPHVWISSVISVAVGLLACVMTEGDGGGKKS